MNTNTPKKFEQPICDYNDKCKFLIEYLANKDTTFCKCSKSHQCHPLEAKEVLCYKETKDKCGKPKCRFGHIVPVPVPEKSEESSLVTNVPEDKILKIESIPVKTNVEKLKKPKFEKFVKKVKDWPDEFKFSLVIKEANFITFKSEIDKYREKHPNHLVLKSNADGTFTVMI